MLREKDRCDFEVQRGYSDGRDLNFPQPRAGAHPAYIHGFLNGRDDEEVSRGIRKWPARSHSATKQAWREILAFLDVI